MRKAVPQGLDRRLILERSPSTGELIRNTRHGCPEGKSGGMFEHLSQELETLTGGIGGCDLMISKKHILGHSGDQTLFLRNTGSSEP